jgi:hypothetical protein
MSEYALVEDFPQLIGKRAKIGEPPHYCAYLWNNIGTIEAIYGKLFLKFDTRAVRDEKTDDGMDGVYLTPDSFKIIDNCPEKCPTCGSACEIAPDNHKTDTETWGPLKGQRRLFHYHWNENKLHEWATWPDVKDGE